MTIKEITELLLDNGFDFVKNKSKFIETGQSYYYTNGLTPEKLENRLKEVFPNATIIESGDHFHSFVGGAESGSAKDSYMYVRFTINNQIRQ